MIDFWNSLPPVLQGLLKGAVWVALARSPRKVGYDLTRELSYLALTERVRPFDPEAHAVRRYLNLAHYLGAPPTLPRFRLGLDAAVDISALIPGESDRPLAVLHTRSKALTPGMRQFIALLEEPA